MKASSIFKAITVSLLFIVLSQMSPPFAAPGIKEKLLVATNVNMMLFPPRPEGVNDRLTVSSPVVIIDDGIAARLGGGVGLTKMVRPCLENLLNNSGRFMVLVDGEAPYKVRATLTALKITQVHTKNDAAGVADFIKNGISKL